MSTSSGVSDSEDSCHTEYEPIHRLAMIRVHPPRNPNKPFTSFSISDILANSTTQPHNTYAANGAKIVRPWASGIDRDSDNSSDGDEEINVDDDDDDEPPPSSLKSMGLVSPLDALMEMANKTFEGLESSESADAKRRDQAALFSKHQPPKKRRKSRTAFTNQQIYELEKRFLYQKYLTPADRDEIALKLGLTNAQVITWFQNRRAKLKRDLEELKNDVTAAKTTPVTLTSKYGAIELEMLKAEGRKHAGSDVSTVSQSFSSPEQSPANSPSRSNEPMESNDTEKHDSKT
ncbi:transcription factor LBX1-like [Gigantopelta aegis]|uniref:transcription factor LBX1-like n=1 Tax=Gigantopelta aegis TaxID=1735272 RepID=UPI001B88A42C|nr:transcription factor LBX1-like [Gigantopelta aegis]